ncbi:hypothetical protein HHI36_023672 [Cryptolaemus montrouzieri]|uniref:Uncharacterized protein n=1 Tax=Cryptolaemus montrouzieri TaxID=559131 RepID=A0ABD2PHL2_9CUCU
MRMLEVNDEYMTDPMEIINEFNEYFVGGDPAIVQTLEEENANREAPFGEIHSLSSSFLTVVDEYEIKKSSFGSESWHCGGLRWNKEV